MALRLVQRKRLPSDRLAGEDENIGMNEYVHTYRLIQHDRPSTRPSPAQVNRCTVHHQREGNGREGVLGRSRMSM